MLADQPRGPEFRSPSSMSNLGVANYVSMWSGIKINGFQNIPVQYSSWNANIQVASLIEIVTKSHTALKKEDIYIYPIFYFMFLCEYCAMNKLRLVNIPIILQSYHLFIVRILKPILSVSIKYTLLPTYVTYAIVHLRLFLSISETSEHSLSQTQALKVQLYSMDSTSRAFTCEFMTQVEGKLTWTISWCTILKEIAQKSNKPQRLDEDNRGSPCWFVWRLGLTS